MTADMTGSATFLTEAAGLAQRLLERGRAVFDVRYDGLAFGSWVLTAGTPKRRVRVTWDGREPALRIEVAEFGDSRSRPAWRVVSDAPVADQSPGALLRLAEASILAESGAPAA
jgi:hypothetical protein